VVTKNNSDSHTPSNYGTEDCRWCGTTFIKRHWMLAYCSPECRKEARQFQKDEFKKEKRRLEEVKKLKEASNFREDEVYNTVMEKFGGLLNGKYQSK